MARRGLYTLSPITCNKSLEIGTLKSGAFTSLIESFKRGSVFFEVLQASESKGIIGLELISQMNEFKLMRLHFQLEPEAFDEAIKGLLDYAINEYFVLKIVCELNDEALINSLLKNGFVINKNLEDGLVEVKITKPIYLGR